MSTESPHTDFMRRCLQLASNGRATCSPNPMVGALLVHEGRIVGEGWHRKAGEPHAEPLAIASVPNKNLLEKCTLYVSLEPCSHYGKTPPCVELILRSHIPRVVIGTLDPFPLVSGRGVKKLREGGVEVVVGVLEEECRALNRFFLHFQHEHRPWIILKWAQTEDGFIDLDRNPGDNQPPLKISTPFTQMLTHKLRSECDAILVGTRTALLDNPSLTVRSWTGKNPIRVLLDRSGAVPGDYKLFDRQSESLVFTTGMASRRSGNISYINLNFNEKALESLLAKLAESDIQSLLVEGGAKLHESFLQTGLWDEIQVEISPQRLGTGVKAPVVNGLVPTEEYLVPSHCGIENRIIRRYVRV